MSLMAQWRNKRFEVSRDGVKAMENLSTSMKLKNFKDSEGGEYTGFEPQAISFNFQVSDIAGVDVRMEWEEWLQLTGEIGPLYIGGLLFGPDNLRLSEAKLEADIIDDLGRIRQGTISLTFTEVGSESSAKTARVRSYVSIKRSTAADVGASQADKAARKPYSI